MKTVYVLQSTWNPNRFYTGVTNEVRDRLERHNKGYCPYTKPYRPWKLVATFSFENDATANRFEKYLKSGSGREWIKKRMSL